MIIYNYLVIFQTNIYDLIGDIKGVKTINYGILLLSKDKFPKT